MTEQPSGGPPPPPPPDPYFVTAPSGPSIPATPTPAPAKRKFPVAATLIAVVVVLALLAAYGFWIQSNDRPAPTEAEVAAAFVPIQGYEYTEMPAESLEPLRQAFAAEGAQEAVAHFDARQVSSGSSPEGVVFILSIDPDEMKGAFEESYVQGFTATSQTSVEDFMIGDTTGHIAETPLGTIAFFFDEDGYAFNIVGRDRSTVQSIAEALEAGNS